MTEVSFGPRDTRPNASPDFQFFTSANQGLLYFRTAGPVFAALYFLAAAAISSGVPSMVSTISFLGHTWAQRPQESQML